MQSVTFGGGLEKSHFEPEAVVVKRASKLPKFVGHAKLLDQSVAVIWEADLLMV